MQQMFDGSYSKVQTLKHVRMKQWKCAELLLLFSF